MANLYVMVGCSYSGKSTVAEKMNVFQKGLIVSTDVVREEVLGDANDQSHGKLIFDIAHQRVETALKLGWNVFFDATNLDPRSRKPLIDIARKCNADKVIAIVCRVPLGAIGERMQGRERVVPREVVMRQLSKFRYPTIGEGFDFIFDWSGKEICNGY